jgi:hypothetical protein
MWAAAVHIWSQPYSVAHLMQTEIEAATKQQATSIGICST